MSTLAAVLNAEMTAKQRQSPWINARISFSPPLAIAPPVPVIVEHLYRPEIP